MTDEREAGGLPSPAEIASGFIRGHEEAIKQIGEPMLKDASKSVRFIARRAPGAPGLLLDGVTVASEPDKLRGVFGLIGAAAGAAGGGALGAAAGGVNAPLGAAVGSAFGDEIGQEFYDEHKARIQAAKRWIEDRTAELLRR